MYVHYFDTYIYMQLLIVYINVFHTCAAAVAQMAGHATAVAWIRANPNPSLCPSRELAGRVVVGTALASSLPAACMLAKRRALHKLQAQVHTLCYRYIVVSGCSFKRY